VGVCVGHALYYAGKKALVDKTIDMNAQLQTSVFLGAAAFCSGTVWQPSLNLLQAHGVNFIGSCMATGAACGGFFFLGLRGGRHVFSLFMPAIEKPSYANLKADAQLSLAIGGASACFVGTDISYGAANFLSPVLGIAPDTPVLFGSLLAGSSTALGFTSLQMVENIVTPRAKNWVD